MRSHTKLVAVLAAGLVATAVLPIGDAFGATAKTTKDGWLKTGDLARQNRAGLIAFATRKKDVVKHGGYSVFPAEVEAQLAAHPQIAEAVVFGVPHPTKGAVPAAAIVLAKGATTNEADLPADRANYRHRGRGFWEGKARIIGTDVAAWVADMFDHAAELSPLRAVQQVVTLLETYPTNRANAACRRAMRFDIRNYREIKRILVEAIDFEALPDRLPMDLPSPAPASAPPRFARPISQMLAHVQKVAHGTH